METRYITLKDNDALIEFCNYYNKSIDEVTDLVIENLLKYKLLYDEPSECGLNLRYIIDESHVCMDAFCVACFGVSGNALQNFINDFQIWGLHNGCPKCGCKLQAKDHLFTEWLECSNPECDHEQKENCTPFELLGDRYQIFYN